MTVTDNGSPTGPAATPVLLDVRNLVQEFTIRTRREKSRTLRAVSDVSFEIRHGETLGLVGETGSGKSTVARSVLMAPRPKSGEVVLDGTDLAALHRKELLETRRSMQMVFQDPFDSLDPKWKVRDIVAEPLNSYRVGTSADRDRRVAELLDLVGLDVKTYGDRHARQLSGGQCQRVAIARALALSPRLIVCDEAVASLDVLIQAQVLNLLEKLRRELGLSYLFIAHDLALVKQVSDRVAVMYLGKLVEVGPANSIYREPLHPYTAALLASIPVPDPEAPPMITRGVIDGETPSALDPPSGCRFRTRCPYGQSICASEEPPLRVLGPDHSVACHFPLGRPEASVSLAASYGGPA